MPLMPGRTARPQRRHRVDSKGEFYTPPGILNYIWVALIILLVVEAVNETSGFGGPTSLYAGWIHDGILAAAAFLILARARYEPTARAAWLAIGLAMASFFVGSVGWSLAYGARAHPPFPTFADIFWLMWYPLMALGLFRLVQSGLRKFSWHRWMDGVAVMLVVLTAGVALIIEPAADAGVQGPVASIIDFSYPVLDVLMIGAIIGVYGLLGWHPGRMWIILGAGVVIMAIADSVYAIQEVGGTAGDTRYSSIWTTGAVVIAYAAWVRVPEVRDAPIEITGLRAVALPLIAQALAIAIQFYAFFGEVPRGERLVTVAVLVLSSIQIILTRPRPHSTDSPVRPAQTAHDQEEGT